MTRTATFLFLLATLTACACCAAVSTSHAGPLAAANIQEYPRPEKAQDMVFRAATGQEVPLSAYRGRVVLLHFWRINCPACRTEEPVLQWLKKNYGPYGLEILGINMVDPPKQAAQFAAQQRFTFPVFVKGAKGFNLQLVNMAGKETAFLINPNKEAILEVPALPTTYIVNKGGDLVARSVGAAQWNHGTAQGFIRNLLSGGSDAPSRPGPVSRSQTLDKDAYR